MGGVTPRGYPYVVSTDKPLEAPTHSQALANKLEAGPFSARGTVSIPVVASLANSANIAVTFPAGLFTAAPSIVAVTGSTRLTPGVVTVTATGATLVFSNWTTAATPGTTTGFWIAVGV